MPELPEVKTIQDQLNTLMPFNIGSIELSSVSGSIVHTPLDALAGEQIVRVERKGKLLNFIVANGWHILSHLGMSGSWLMSDQAVRHKHTHLQFKGEGTYLAYVDPRRFGHLYYLSGVAAQAKLASLGPDLLSSEFTLDYFLAALDRYPERCIKVSLLDQRLFAGTGNYIANEICAHAGVLPFRIVASLKLQEREKLYHSVATVLAAPIQMGGVAFGGGYQDAHGEKGRGVHSLVVFYQKKCQLCQDSEVIKITLGQRGTYYCPRCQH
jgi:formamidopyrimidine-DNA glycosylase